MDKDTTVSSRRAILFDLDDTLIAFDAVTDVSWEHVCREYAATHPPVSPERLRSTIREQSRWYWSDEERHRRGRLNLAATRRSIVETAMRALSLPVNDAGDLAERYDSIRTRNIYLAPSAIATLEAVRSRGFKTALVTNGEAESQRAKINRFGIEQYFDHVLIEGELGFGKPDSRVFTTALSALEVRPRDTWMVGDNLVWDVAGPLAVGIPAIWVDWRRRGLPDHASVVPSAIIHEIGELLDLIL